MKERIVIEKELLEKIIKASPIQWFDNKEKTDKLILFGKEYKTEKYPTNWEELKELCKGLKGIEFFYDKVACVEYININDVIAFNENGLMLMAKHNYDILAKRRTPQQMWNIIKSLIGEE